jgi:tetratricopeptide (TPR) repeat protein
MRGLTTPPAGLDRIDWEMRRARVLILGGAPRDGARVVNQLIETTPTFENATLDRLLQVIFDLQTVGLHDEALTLFGQIDDKPLDGQRRRELLFWMADSHRALGRHQESAFHYLRSATLLDPFSMDRWAQTARYQAARELAAAELYEDAQRLFRSLLNATKDTGRRAVLRREIQQLQLKQRTMGAAPKAAAANPVQ